MFQLSRASRVGIIGAGPAGLCSAAQLLKLGYNNFKVFEKAGSLGGTWRYSENPYDDRSSSMYQNLRTNLPKECMAFPNFNFPDLPTSFPGHRDVLNYLNKYAEHHDLIKFIDFENSVISVNEIGESKNKWKIETERNESDVFDFVIVANGHYSRPYLPPIFENSSFEGEIIHSHVYRNPESYKDKNVLVIGVGPSGTDIAIDILPFSRSVSLLGGKNIPGLPTGIKMYIGWPESISEAGVRTSNDEFIKTDSIIVSSGYKYDFSFMNGKIELGDCEKKVNDMYRQILPARYPTVGCIGIPSIIVPFPLIECQVRWLISIWERNIKLPPLEERLMESQKVPGCGSAEISRHFHKMGSFQWAYNDLLAKEGGFDPIPRSVQQLYERVHYERREYGPVDYRFTKYKLTDGNSFTCSR